MTWVFFIRVGQEWSVGAAWRRPRAARRGPGAHCFGPSLHTFCRAMITEGGGPKITKLNGCCAPGGCHRAVISDDAVRRKAADLGERCKQDSVTCAGAILLRDALMNFS